jgi:hypothetical protein
MTENLQILRHACKTHCFHVVGGPATEALLMTMLGHLGPIPQGEAK